MMANCPENTQDGECFTQVPDIDDLLISVCIPTYNQERYIETCLRSVLAQTASVTLEILVGDDCSTDKTPSLISRVAEQHPGTIQYIRHNQQQGPIGNLLQLIQRSSGHFIAHLDGDDYWLPHKLSEQMKLLRRHPLAVAAYSNAIVVNDSDVLVGQFNNSLPECFDLAQLVSRGNFLNHSSLLYSARLRNQILTLKPPFIDYRIHLTLASAGPVAYTSKALVVYRHKSSTSMLTLSNEHVRECYWEALVSVPEGRVSKNALRRSYADFLRRVLFKATRTGRFGLVRRWWSLVRQQHPGSTGILLGLLVLNVMRQVWLQATQWLCTKISRVNLRVLYFR